MLFRIILLTAQTNTCKRICWCVVFETRHDTLTELSAPVTEVVESDHVVSKPLRDVRYKLSKYCGAKVSAVEWLGNVR